MVDRGRATGCLIIMVKEPRIGAVKTRLAREIGSASALRFYRSVSGNLIRRLAHDRRWRTVLAVSPDRAIASPAWPACIRRSPQGVGDLGARMERLLRSQGRCPAVLIGSDIPGVRAAHIAEAFGLLRACDAVFGPAADGGFWLVGLNSGRRSDRMFKAVRWSSPNALADTLRNLDGQSVGFAATLSDVDGAQSYRQCGHLGARVTLGPAQPNPPR